jgi:hypothetical protein
MLQQNESRQRWHWREMQLELTWMIPTSEPEDPEPGAEWFDPTTGCLYVWDGAEWVCEPRD